MSDICFNPYEKLKDKYKKEFNERMHFNNLLRTSISMFEYKNIDDTVREDEIEKLLLTQGVCGFKEIDGKIYTGYGSYCGEIFNGLPTEFLITVVGIPEIMQGKVGDEYAVMWNNSIRQPDFDLMFYSSILAEIDVSERLNVLFSRLLRIPKAKDNKEKMAITECINNILIGKMDAIVSDNIKERLLTGEETEKFLDLVDVKDIDKLQYLNQYRDNVVKRFFQLNGHGLNTTSKLAQQTNDEIHGTQNISMILPYEKLKYRKKGVEMINKMFNRNWSVDFSECWKRANSVETVDNVEKEKVN